LRQDLAKTVDEIWGEHQHAEKFVGKNFAAAIDSLRRWQAYPDTLDPQTDRQRRALAARMQAVDAIAQSQLQTSFALTSPDLYPLLFVVWRAKHAKGGTRTIVRRPRGAASA
jgi:hypothetical protein